VVGAGLTASGAAPPPPFPFFHPSDLSTVLDAPVTQVVSCVHRGEAPGTATAEGVRRESVSTAPPEEEEDAAAEGAGRIGERTSFATETGGTADVVFEFRVRNEAFGLAIAAVAGGCELITAGD
jgi:hypothetical protein